MGGDFIFLRPILMIIIYMPIRIREESKQITEVFSFYDLNVDTAMCVYSNSF
jgi:hypothetical protein